jgi:peptidoglycan-associated lipoprotein
MRQSLIVVTALAFAAAGASGCATKGYVKTQVAQVSTKVDTLGQSLEETQQRTRTNETRITEVDAKAGAAAGAASQANSAAGQANTAAGAADQRARAAADSATAATAKAEEVEKASRRMVYEVVLNENQGGFKFNSASLPDEAKASLDTLIDKIKADPNGAYFEIEGHTDNTGDKLTNVRIGQERAETVKRYLYEQHQIPLHKMNVISYGQDKPAAPNTTRDGRAQNRRVVIRVLV